MQNPTRSLLHVTILGKWPEIPCRSSDFNQIRPPLWDDTLILPPRQDLGHALGAVNVAGQATVMDEPFIAVHIMFRPTDGWLV